MYVFACVFLCNKHTQSSKLAITPSATETTSRHSYRTKANAIAVQEEPVSVVSPNSFKLNRRPGRWQYKSSPKPKVNIRKNANPNLPTTIQNDTAPNDVTPVEIITNEAINNGRDLEASGSQNGPVANNNKDDPNSKYFVQTLNVEISTPQPFIDTYYEIATIKTPFIFQVILDIDHNHFLVEEPIPVSPSNKINLLSGRSG